MRRTFHRTTRIWLAAMLAASAALVGCSHGSGADEESSNSQNAVAEVTVTRVARADITRTATVTGSVAALPNRDVRVSSLVPGRVAALNVAEGDFVHSGDLLARIDDRPYRDQLQQAEAAAAQARASLENAKLQLARNETLFSQGIAARKDLEDARTQQAVAEAALRQAEAALSISKLQLARTEIRAPISGRVAKRFTGVGEQVDGTAAQPLVELADLREIELLGNVPAAYLAAVHVGESVPVTSESLPTKAFTGRVVGVSPAVDPSSNSGLVRIRIANAEGLLRLGMFLSAEIPVETHPRALIVPAAAIYRDAAGKPEIFHVEGDSATSVEATLGIESGGRVELLSGAREGDTVILTGGYGLPAKSKIKIKP